MEKYIKIDNNYLKKIKYFPPFYYDDIKYDGEINEKKEEFAEKELIIAIHGDSPFCPLIKDMCNSWCINYQKPFIDKMTLNCELVYFVYKNYCKYFKVSF